MDELIDALVIDVTEDDGNLIDSDQLSDSG
jgi:hypothetical protein